MELLSLDCLGRLLNLSCAELCFWFLFVFRYLRLIVHIVAFFFLYQPAPVLAEPTVTPSDCTVIIPTVDPGNEDFIECLTTVLANQPSYILIVTVGDANSRLIRQIIAPLRDAYPNSTIDLLSGDIANKRQQVCQAIPYVQTRITLLVDDHVFWPSTNFLRSAIAPFEDPSIGAVGTNKRVRRQPSVFGFSSFWNVIGALYLERHNFEIRATNAIDGGVFVISGRTAAYRSYILQDPDFMTNFTNERFFFGLFGPLNADDDNFITRWVARHGWKIKIQYTSDAMIETTLGTYPKFLSQCLRWARTTWRSNTASLLTDRTVWFAQPWCVYAVYISSLVNFALFYDALLIYTLYKSPVFSSSALKILVACILVSKLVKILPYFLRHPSDLIYLPGYYIFAYFHSFLKLYAGLTFWVTAWSGRTLSAVSSSPSTNSSSSPAHSSSNSRSSSAHPSSSSLRKRKNPISTPWGPVSPSNPHTKPANFSETLTTGMATHSDMSRALRSRRESNFGHDGAVDDDEAKENSKHYELVSKVKYNRPWARGHECGRLHGNATDSASRYSRAWERDRECSRLHSYRISTLVGDSNGYRHENRFTVG